MGMIAWVMMGIALWHFTVFVPDRFAGGIVGAFVAASIGAAVFGFLLHGGSVPGEADTGIVTAIEGAPGAVLGMALTYLWGVRRGNEPLHL